ncbi:MAG: Ig-like domain-containing protein [Thermoplasmatota archaeon]
MISVIAEFPASSDRSTAEAASSGSRYVFVEDITATWCAYCPSASEGLKDLATQRNDFRFITLVDDRVPDAASRVEEYNPSGFPTVLFDGGYDEKVGGVSSGDEYNENIDHCLDREVPDIDMSVSGFDMGGSEVRVEVTVTNNMNEQYDGVLKAMVVEKVSRYLDSDGNNYPQSMLGYVINDQFTVYPGEEFSLTGSWVGADNEDLLGDDFSDIEKDNIVVYAVAFNSQNHYKKHPGLNANTFTAHYADAMAESPLSEIGNAPEVKITSPSDGDTVEGQVEITADITSTGAIETVEVKVGGDIRRQMDLQGSQYVHTWDSTEAGNGWIRISVRTHDDQGLSGIDNIEVNVKNQDSSTPPEILVLTHEPLAPEEGDTVEVELELFLYDTTITSARIVICPDGSCLAPEDMIPQSVDIFTIEMGPYDASQVVSYHVIVEDSEGNVVESVENIFTVRAMEQSTDHDDIVVDDDPDGIGGDDETGSVDGAVDRSSIIIVVIAVIAVAAVIIISIALMIRKGKEEQDHQYGANDRRSQQEPIQAYELELEEVHVK